MQHYVHTCPTVKSFDQVDDGYSYTIESKQLSSTMCTIWTQARYSAITSVVIRDVYQNLYT